MRHTDPTNDYDAAMESAAVLTGECCMDCRHLKYLNGSPYSAALAHCVEHVIKFPWPTRSFDTATTFNEPRCLVGHNLSRYGCERFQPLLKEKP